MQAYKGKFHKSQSHQNLKPQASEMPHHAKHHASENRRAIERSLVIRTMGGSSLGEGRL